MKQILIAMVFSLPVALYFLSGGEMPSYLPSQSGTPTSDYERNWRNNGIEFDDITAVLRHNEIGGCAKLRVKHSLYINQEYLVSCSTDAGRAKEYVVSVATNKVSAAP
ncbi:MAG: hypothetical protein OEQ39_15295 [Gammaproteobacteria bacterium]|nr:hypothetical protein [Gammaproteobacteria bacterium]MDH3465084.1 hypothetical protein [Gammaproteobacteria bacterium]